MIEGNLKDASLPGLLQFLASEANKLYQVKLSTAGQSGEIYVCNGQVIHASFNLLAGEDALCEFLSWRDGLYEINRLAGEFEATIKKNISLHLEGPTTFVAQSAFLTESNVGLNTTVVASKHFGSLDWQEAIRTQPLEQEDFVVLGWLKAGRSVRQAAREFALDIVKATGILYRLLLTHSVEVLRTGTETGQITDGQATSAQANTQETVPRRASKQEKMSSPNQPKAGELIEKPQPESTSSLVTFSQTSGHVFDGATASVSSAMSAPGGAIEAQPYLAGQAVAGNSVREDAIIGATQEKNGIDCAPDVVAPVVPDEEEDLIFSGRRTEALPLVTIDIERLLQATFTATQFGKLALNNQALDQHLRQTLLDVEACKNLQLVINSSIRTPASVLSTYRFCLARGYIISSDPVVPLTADLLLGRIEIDQYLLQRRRINGDELRDLIEIQRQKGLKLSDLLVRSGYLTAGDVSRLSNEQKRFALK